MQMPLLAQWGLYLCAALLLIRSDAIQEVGTKYDIRFGTDPPFSDDAYPVLLPQGVTIDSMSGTFKLTHPGATYLSVHYKAFNLPARSSLEVSGASGDTEYTLTRKGNMGAFTFWGQHIVGDTITLRLVGDVSLSDQPGEEWFGFELDEYAAGHVMMSPEAICGADDKRNAICYATSHGTEYAKSKSVARLLIAGSSLCTGWRVGSSTGMYLMTNEHCINTNSRALNTDYEFMGEAPDCGNNNCQMCYKGTVFRGGTLVAVNAAMDYALISLGQHYPEVAAYGYLEVRAGSRALVGETIYIPQHAGGDAKQLAIMSDADSSNGGRCQVNSVTKNACSGSGYQDVGYSCDTEGGSSGSPVLSIIDHYVIGLHHCANCENRAVPIDLICTTLDCSNLVPSNFPTPAPVTPTTTTPTASPATAPAPVAPTPSPDPSAASYSVSSVGTCNGVNQFITAKAECEVAATALGLEDQTASDASSSTNPYGCYWKALNGGGSKLWFNPNGDMGDDDTTRVSICTEPTLPAPLRTTSPTSSPTSSPTTSTPTTSSPTSSPTNAPTPTPTSSPTDAPTTPTPTSAPTDAPTTPTPTASPTDVPTLPASLPTTSPTSSPTTPTPTASPTDAPTTTTPTSSPTDAPTTPPTLPASAGSTYMKQDVGECLEGSEFIVTKDDCEVAAAALGLGDTTAGTAEQSINPYGCYWKDTNSDTHKLWFNPNGGMNDDDIRRVSICRVA